MPLLFINCPGAEEVAAVDGSAFCARTTGSAAATFIVSCAQTAFPGGAALHLFHLYFCEWAVLFFLFHTNNLKLIENVWFAVWPPV